MHMIPTGAALLAFIAIQSLENAPVPEVLSIPISVNNPRLRSL